MTKNPAYNKEELEFLIWLTTDYYNRIGNSIIYGNDQEAEYYKELVRNVIEKLENTQPEEY